ncbi:translation initiation factor eIF2 assembly protein-like [Haliotis cracherodii]|uniref:translation initiation factor eIF2 assembly protein-like n=1 Tax=Haliotis cracherodii TaxID=6455 RepID=UPI0039E88263
MGRTDVNNLKRHKMKKEHVLNCSFSSWYDRFKDLTIKSVVLPLPQEFIDYLHKDGVVLPEGSVQGSSQSRPEDENDDDDDVDWGSGSAAVAVAPEFPEFERLVKKAIQKLGGRVFPKLNWSAPRDATWISFDKTLKCTCPSDVYLLLKSSDFIAHDLSQPFLHCSDCDLEMARADVKYDLILRRWQDLQPGMEFRCFVRNKKLIAISQRHHIQYYAFLETQKDEIISDIQAFFYHMISNKFPDESYVFDVYRKDKGHLTLVDFNPFGEVTDALLFTWEELANDSGELKAERPEFRFLQSKDGVQPNPFAYFAMPRDFVDLAAGEDPYKLMDLLHLKVQTSTSENTSSDEDTTS